CVEATNMKKQEWELDASKLTVENLIGFGGFGAVYTGLYNHKQVAVKVFDLRDGKKNSIEKKQLMEEVFMQEVSIWCKLQHSNIAEFIGAIKKKNMSKIKIKCQKGAKVLGINGYCCIVVEYVGGGTLQSYLSKHTILKKKLPLDTTIQLALDVAKGLSYIHSNKIAHRDVKTENLLVDKTGRVKIIDFGISSKFYSMVGTSGTMGYMAPEVLSDSSYDHKCDVYSFAICLWEMYTCLDPYPEHISHSKISHQIYKDRRPEIPKCCPRALSDIMKKCWDVKPQNRPEMKEVVQMLVAIKTRRQQQ
ncbi:hypothetical protein MTR67_051208, partial [Solanum verrucosum]